MGRPSTYTPEIAERICAELAEGKSVARACDADDMPEQRTVFRWLTQHESFRQQYMRAREARADARFERTDQVLLDMRAGVIDASQARVELDAIKWQTGKEAPKRYGDRLELAGDPNNPVLPPKILVEFVDAPKRGKE